MINPNPRVHLGSVPVKTIEPVNAGAGSVPVGTCGIIQEWSAGSLRSYVYVRYTNGLSLWTWPDCLTVISWSEYHS